MLTSYVLRYLCILSYISITSTLLSYNIQYIIYCTKYHFDIDIIMNYILYRKLLIIALFISYKLYINYIHDI